MCGQCCGAEGSPNQANPWPKSWPDSFRTWKYQDVYGMWPHSELLGIVPNPNTGDVVLLEQAGTTKIGEKEFPWVWVSGHAVCKPGTIECPFLLPDPGNGTRPCGLVDTEYEWMWDEVCRPGIPPLELHPDAVAQWFENHPLCSFEYVE